jgi:YbgC/YbaW family acyl-CoA thioester hydrolase
MNKTPSSAYVIRFSDCDPFGHLNNARYLDYFNNAREDHLKEAYQMDLSELYKKGTGWLAVSHNITYIKPASFNEQVHIQSALLQADASNLLVEFQMMNAARTHLKALMWTRYVPVSLSTGKKDVHTPEFMDFLLSLVLDDVPVEKGHAERLTALLTELKKAV